MNKILIALSLFFTLAYGVEAQTINDVLEEMPRDIIYGLNPDLNERLLENTTDTSRFVSTTIYGKIKREAITSDYIALRTSEGGLTEIKLLPLINQSKIICVVQTVCATICDSKITFYTEKWDEIDSSLLLPKRDIQWFIKTDEVEKNEKYDQAVSSLSIDAMKYSLSPDADILWVEYNPQSFLPIEEYKAVEPYLTNKPKELKWNKVKFGI